MPATELEPILGLELPYPGLRSFEPEEAFLFYGRQSHTEELLKRLATNQFLAVVGTSGSGKSSLVRAGLMPALYRGFLAGAISRWRIALMKPGDAPMENLAKALAGINIPAEELSRSSVGLRKAVKAANLASDEGVLLVLDQFEELFRFTESVVDNGAEANLFVTSLLEAADSFATPIYVVLTMRADFIGECTQFAGLAEALNRGQYLIPRLTREQRREAIEKPVRMVNAVIAPRLVQRLLNELGEDADQLPVMQHALNRTFLKWKNAGSVGEIDFEHYEAAHTVEGALNDHADELMDQLPLAAVSWTERVFRCLTTTLANGRPVRRPTRFDLLMEVLGIKPSDEQSAMLVQDVIQLYSRRENSLLICSPEGELKADTFIDISHESLITHWTKLKAWVIEEASAVSWYRSAAEDSLRYSRREAPTWRDPKLSVALAFLESGAWTEAWGRRHCMDCTTNFESVRHFLMTGAKEQQRENLRGRMMWIAIVVLLAVALFALSLVAAYQRELYHKRASLQAGLITTQSKIANLDSQAHNLSDKIASTKQDLADQTLSEKSRRALENLLIGLQSDLERIEDAKVQQEKRKEIAVKDAQDAGAPVPAAVDQTDASGVSSANSVPKSRKVTYLVGFSNVLVRQNYDAAWIYFSTEYQNKHDKDSWGMQLIDLAKQHGGPTIYHLGTISDYGTCKMRYRDGFVVDVKIDLVVDGARGLAVSNFELLPKALKAEAS